MSDVEVQSSTFTTVASSDLAIAFYQIAFDTTHKDITNVALNISETADTNTYHVAV